MNNNNFINARYLALFLLLAVGIIFPNTSSLEAEKVTPSIQQNTRTYLVADKTSASAPTSNQDAWRALNYENLLAYTPNPKQGGDYISLLTQRTEQRYEQIRRMNIPADEKTLLAKKVYNKTNRKIGKVKSLISKYLRSSSKSI